MSTERDILAGRINAAIEEWDDAEPGKYAAHVAGHIADAILATGYRRPRTVATIDELDAAVYTAFEDDGHLVLTDRQGRPWIIWADEDGDEVVNSWPQEEDPERLTLSDIRLPATVMHHGARTLLHEPEAHA